MSERERERTKNENIKTKKLKKEKSVDKAKTEMINEIIDNIRLLIEESEAKEEETDKIGGKITRMF